MTRARRKTQKKGPKDGLSPKQARFVAEYRKDGNATQAAIRAGYSAKTAYSQGERLLRNVEVAAALRVSQERTMQRLEINADEILLENLRLARSDIRKALAPDGSLRPADEWPDDLAAAVSSIKVRTVYEGTGEDRYPVTITELKLWDKGSAIDRTFKHLGLYEKDNSQGRLGSISDELLDRLISAFGG